MNGNGTTPTAHLGAALSDSPSLDAQDRWRQVLGSALHKYGITLGDVDRDVPLGIPNCERAVQLPPEAAVEDMAMALACSRGNSEALSAFALDCEPEFRAVAFKLGLTEEQRSDARQKLWQRLFVGDGEPPRILEYHGKGRLRHWFRVLASRFLLNEIRGIKRQRLVYDSDCGELQAAAERDPELQLLDQSCRQQFRAALQQALQQLRADQRNALRCHYLHSMTIDRMAEVFGIHRATAARRIVSARDELFRLTREYLREALKIDTEELNSVIRHAQGESSMSVARLLGQVSGRE